jgi:outer membrane protein assembly factor BamB
MGPLAITANGRVFAAIGSNKILEFSPTTGEPIGTPIDLGAVSHYGYRKLVAAPSGQLLLGSDANYISRFNPDTGEYLGHFVPAGSGGLTSVTMATFTWRPAATGGRF